MAIKFKGLNDYAKARAGRKVDAPYTAELLFTNNQKE